ncbi:hypothetical protein OIU35_00220 [Boseaceae bacterium BT-24-1]|nr:hypothetical protein [Boseaceae bacterium BT-24-1]
MLDITPDDIAALQDDVLRELVGRLCEAAVRVSGQSPSGVTWSGSQDAGDGGIDVRVEAQGDLTGFVPSKNTGYQVKKPDLAGAAIREEMAPKGKLRASIKELADTSGAYVIVSSGASVADSALAKRRAAMRVVLSGISTGPNLITDFYDRRRLVTWLSEHPALIPWVRRKAGRPISGWQSFGPWAVAPEKVDATYLADDKVRLVINGKRGQELSALGGLAHVRDTLSRPRKSVRLVGLSGVGKTRFVQALFEDIGENALDRSSVIYADMADSPDPLPTALASSLIAQKRAIVVVLDNCPADLHRRMTELCRAPGSLVSLLTVEYDIRDDEPEGSDTVKLEAASADLIERVIRLHVPDLTPHDAATIARSDISGGNARIALALARTHRPGESLSHLNDAELFRRLFQQRNEHDPRLLAAAEVCSLVYSFDADTVTGDGAELPLLAKLVGQSVDELYRHVAVLKGRDLVQQRGRWRAVLPHAVANRLAKAALKQLPIASIEAQLVDNGSVRIARSFSRRLGYLHDSAEAVAVAQRWLGRNGRLGEVDALNELGMVMFANVAPVAPKAALEAIERAVAKGGQSGLLDEAGRRRHTAAHLVHKIAYDAALFDRCVDVLVAFAKAEKPNDNSDSASGLLCALFQARSSRTHATVDQRLSKIRTLIRSADSSEQAMGFKFLTTMLKTARFSPRPSSDFGNLARDLGYEPHTPAQIEEWFTLSIQLAADLFNEPGLPTKDLRSGLAPLLPGLCADANVHEAVELLIDAASAKGYWQDAWVSVRSAIRFAHKHNHTRKIERLRPLERKLSPSNLSERIRAVVFCQSYRAIDLVELEMGQENDFEAARAKLDALAEEYGRQVAGDAELFVELRSAITAGSGVYLGVFGRGMGLAADNPEAIWKSLRLALTEVPEQDRNIQAMLGFIEGLNRRSPEQAVKLLDAAIDDDVLGVFFPVIQTAAGLDVAGMARLLRAANIGHAPVWRFSCLAGGRATEKADPVMLSELLKALATAEHGHLVAIDVLAMHFHGHNHDRIWSPDLITAGKSLLALVRFSDEENKLDYDLSNIASICLKGPGGALMAASLVKEYRKAASERFVSAYDFNQFLSALFAVQPEASLDASLLEPPDKQLQGRDPFEDDDIPVGIFGSVPIEALMAWCLKDPQVRFERAATYVPYMTAASGNEKPTWTPVALEILQAAPNKAAVLERFTARVESSGWGNERADIERRADLLLELDRDGRLGLREFATEAHRKLSEIIKCQREWEEKREREHDEAFE